jgi:hypothetical protein
MSRNPRFHRGPSFGRRSVGSSGRLEYPGHLFECHGQPLHVRLEPVCLGHLGGGVADNTLDSVPVHPSRIEKINGSVSGAVQYGVGGQPGLGQQLRPCLSCGVWVSWVAAVEEDKPVTAALPVERQDGAERFD